MTLGEDQTESPFLSIDLDFDLRVINMDALTKFFSI